MLTEIGTGVSLGSLAAHHTACGSCSQQRAVLPGNVRLQSGGSQVRKDPNQAREVIMACFKSVINEHE